MATLESCLAAVDAKSMPGAFADAVVRASRGVDCDHGLVMRCAQQLVPRQERTSQHFVSLLRRFGPPVHFFGKARCLVDCDVAAGYPLRPFLHPHEMTLTQAHSFDLKVGIAACLSSQWAQGRDFVVLYGVGSDFILVYRDWKGQGTGTRCLEVFHEAHADGSYCKLL